MSGVFLISRSITIAIAIAVSIARLTLLQLRQNDAKDMRMNGLKATKRGLDPAHCYAFCLDHEHTTFNGPRRH